MKIHETFDSSLHLFSKQAFYIILYKSSLLTFPCESNIHKYDVSYCSLNRLLHIIITNLIDLDPYLTDISIEMFCYILLFLI